MSDNAPQKIDGSAHLRVLQLLHWGVLIAPCMFGIFVVYSNKSPNMDFSRPNDLFIYIVPLVALAGYFLSTFIFRKILDGLHHKKSLQEKLTGYLTASLTKFALLEGPALLSFFAYLKSNHPLYVLIGISLVVYLFFQRPGKNVLIKDLQLEHADQHLFKNS